VLELEHKLEERLETEFVRAITGESSGAPSVTRERLGSRDYVSKSSMVSLFDKANEVLGVLENLGRIEKDTGKVEPGIAPQGTRECTRSADPPGSRNAHLGKAKVSIEQFTRELKVLTDGTNQAENRAAKATETYEQKLNSRLDRVGELMVNL